MYVTLILFFICGFLSIVFLCDKEITSSFTDKGIHPRISWLKLFPNFGQTTPYGIDLLISLLKL